jgi:TonB family protein
MAKKSTIITIIMISAAQIFAAEFILGEKFASKRGSQADTTADSALLVRDSAFYLDSAEVAALGGIRGQTMSGQRSRASVMRGIDQNQNTIRKEYQNYIRQGKTLSGGIIVRFKIVPSGEVIEAKIVESNTNDIAFEKGVILAIKKWKFPSVQIENDTTIVEYPFVFDKIN